MDLRLSSKFSFHLQPRLDLNNRGRPSVRVKCCNLYAHSHVHAAMPSQRRAADKVVIELCALYARDGSPFHRPGRVPWRLNPLDALAVNQSTTFGDLLSLYRHLTVIPRFQHSAVPLWLQWKPMPQNAAHFPDLVLS